MAVRPPRQDGRPTLVLCPVAPWRSRGRGPGSARRSCGGQAPHSPGSRWRLGGHSSKIAAPWKRSQTHNETRRAPTVFLTVRAVRHLRRYSSSPAQRGGLQSLCGSDPPRKGLSTDHRSALVAVAPLDKYRSVDIDDVLRQQDGVISRRQALAAGFQEHEIRRLLRRNEWARVHAGVYVDHTGPPTWSQRTWAAVLYAAPAALCLESALGAETSLIHVAIERQRSTLTEPAGVLVTHPRRTPPRACAVERRAAADALRGRRTRRRLPGRFRTRCHCSPGQCLPIASNDRTAAAASPRFTGAAPPSPMAAGGTARYRRRHMLGA